MRERACVDRLFSMWIAKHYNVDFEHVIFKTVGINLLL